MHPPPARIGLLTGSPTTEAASPWVTSEQGLSNIGVGFASSVASGCRLGVAVETLSTVGVPDSLGAGETSSVVAEVTEGLGVAEAVDGDAQDATSSVARSTTASVRENSD